MNIKKAPLSEFIYMLAAIALAVAAVALRAVSLFLYFDTDIGYYMSDAWLPIVSNVFAVASVVFFVVFAAVAFRRSPLAYTKKTPLAARIGAGLCALASFFVAVSDLSSKNVVLGVIFSLGATLYFLCVAANRFDGLVGLIWGLCVIARIILALSQSYFNINIQMNAPDKLCFMTAALAVLLFMSAELRAFIGRARPVIYRIFAAVSAVLCAAASLPSILAYLTGHLRALTVSQELYFFLLAFSVYSAIRLVCVTVLDESDESTEEHTEVEDISEIAEGSEEDTKNNDEESI